MNVLGYYVFSPEAGWLQDDEKTWKQDFYSAAEFATEKLANDIGNREHRHVGTMYVLACMGSM